MTRVIIDTNIYLNFYRLNSDQSLEMLKNLGKLIEDGRFELILPCQIEDEFIRNKYSKSVHDDNILKFGEGLSVVLQAPQLIKSTKKFKQIKKTVLKLQSLKEEAVEDYKNRIFNPKSKINKQLEKLFSYSHRSTETDLILQRAWFRTLRGNPPRKNNASFGDAIIWETILDQYTDNDLVLISGDGDFADEIEKEKINKTLLREWSRKSKKKISLYTKLGSFINEYSTNKRKPIKAEIIKEEDRLNSSVVSSSAPFWQGEYSRGSVVCNNIEDATSLLTASMLSIESKCACCSAQTNQLASASGIGMFYPSRCENCQNYHHSGSTCSKCGKHFHRNFNSIYPSFDYKCDECQKKF